MGRSYAGILGPLAMTIVILRGVADGAAADATLWGSVVALAGFALVGMVVGGIAPALAGAQLAGGQPLIGRPPTQIQRTIVLTRVCSKFIISSDPAALG